MTNWKPIGSAPSHEEVLLSDGEDVCTGQFVNGRWVESVNGASVWEGDGEYCGLKDVFFTPTHWAPKPAPPRDSGSDRNGEDALAASGEASQSGPRRERIAHKDPV